MPVASLDGEDATVEITFTDYAGNTHSARTDVSEDSFVTVKRTPPETARRISLRSTNGHAGDWAKAGDTLTLTNGIVERAFLVRGGAFCTVEYRHILADVTYFRAISPEANMTINGTGMDVGGCVGQDRAG